MAIDPTSTIASPSEGVKPRKRSDYVAELTCLERTRRRAQMAQAVNDGKSPEEVALAFEVCKDTVKNACIEHGIQYVTSARRRRLEIVTAIRRGDSVPKIVQEFGIGLGVIRTVCCEHDLRMPRLLKELNRRNAEQIGRSIRRAFRTLNSLQNRNGRTDGMIASEVGLSRERVRQIKKLAKEEGVLR